MEFAAFFVDLFFNLPEVLNEWVATYGLLIYAMLFLIIFMETGLVVTPFLPGDSLLFTAGAVAAVSGGGLNVWVLIAVLLVAAILGDAVNYTIGRRWGRGILDSGRFSRVITAQHIEDTETFFAKHGGKTISIARFFPFIRTFAPFVAGVCHMDRPHFTMYNIIGAIIWVGAFVGAGYFFGNIPVVEERLELLIVGIIAVSVAPGAWHWVQGRIKARKASSGE